MVHVTVVMMLFDLLTTLHNLILRQIRSELLQDERTTEVEGELVASWLALLRKSATMELLADR